MRSVALVDRRVEPSPRIGESLPPAARRLFADMGLLDSFLREPHEPWYANRAVWGGERVRELDFIHDPDGHGWHLDRVRFEEWLRACAVSRGAELLAPCIVERIERHGSRWSVDSSGGMIEASVLIDATGRAAAVARRLGASVETSDRLACGWLYGHDATGAARGLTYIEATEEGWWYSAPLPGSRRVLAFHTDADLPAAEAAHSRSALLESASCHRELSALLTAGAFTADEISGFTAAHSSRLTPCAGDAWLTAGDAALAFDPLSSQGLLNALFTGLAAAEATDRFLGGDETSFTGYAQTIRGIEEVYRRHLATWYGEERRWPEAVFWKRRH